MEKLINPEPTPFCRLMEQENFPGLKNRINLEDTLDLLLSVVEDVDGTEQITQFNSCFKLKNGNWLPNPMVNIAFDAFLTLYDEAYKLRKSDKNFITGLRIFYGLTGANFEVKLLFKPVCYNWNAITSKYDCKEGTKKYYYTADNFIPYTDTEDVEENYRHQILISDNCDEQFREYDSLKNDVLGVTYPFQTIYTLMADNKSDGDNIVMVKNALYRTSTGGLSAKHSVLLLTTLKAAIFRDKFANRSHLCPPGCTELTRDELAVHFQGITTCNP